MSNNFWAKKLAPAIPQAQPVQQSAPANPWWMGPVTPQQLQQNVVAGATAQPQEYSTTKAQSARLSDTCPGCSSSNYFAAPGRQLQRCYDCGYPVIQHFTGAGTPSGMGAEVSGSAKQLPGDHVVTQLDHGRGALASGNHSVISSASEAIAHA